MHKWDFPQPLLEVVSDLQGAARIKARAWEKRISTIENVATYSFSSIILWFIWPVIAIPFNITGIFLFAPLFLTFGISITSLVLLGFAHKRFKKWNRIWGLDNDVDHLVFHFLKKTEDFDIIILLLTTADPRIRAEAKEAFRRIKSGTKTNP